VIVVAFLERLKEVNVLRRFSVSILVPPIQSRLKKSMKVNVLNRLTPGGLGLISSEPSK
jgi:hypothetical protein